MNTKTLAAGLWIMMLSWNVSVIGEQPPNPSPVAMETASARSESKPGVLLPEGYWVDGRLAKLVKHPDQPRWFLLYERSNPSKSQDTLSANPAEPQEKESMEFPPPDPSDPFSVPIEVLPGKALASMDMITNQQSDWSLNFRIWGEITVYHTRNYILPSRVATLSLFGQRSPATRNSNESPLEALQKSKATGETEAQEGGPSGKVLELPSTLREILLQMPRTYPVEWAENSESSQSMTSSGAAIRPDSKASTSSVITVRWKDGDMIMDRVGRLLFDPTEKKWLFAFEADGTSFAEPPMILQPCKLLESMEMLHQGSMEAVTFRISGQVAKYQGRHYLLLRKILIKKNLGNIGR